MKKYNKKQIETLKRYCPEIMTEMNLTKMQKLVELQPPKWPIHTEQGFKEIVEDKIRLNSK